MKNIILEDGNTMMTNYGGNRDPMSIRYPMRGSNRGGYNYNNKQLDNKAFIHGIPKNRQKWQNGQDVSDAEIINGGTEVGPYNNSNMPLRASYPSKSNNGNLYRYNNKQMTNKAFIQGIPQDRKKWASDQDVSDAEYVEDVPNTNQQTVNRGSETQGNQTQATQNTQNTNRGQVQNTQNAQNTDSEQAQNAQDTDSEQTQNTKNHYPTNQDAQNDNTNQASDRGEKYGQNGYNSPSMVFQNVLQELVNTNLIAKEYAEEISNEFGITIDYSMGQNFNNKNMDDADEIEYGQPNVNQNNNDDWFPNYDNTNGQRVSVTDSVRPKKITISESQMRRLFSNGAQMMEEGNWFTNSKFYQNYKAAKSVNMMIVNANKANAMVQNSRLSKDAKQAFDGGVKRLIYQYKNERKNQGSNAYAISRENAESLEHYIDVAKQWIKYIRKNNITVDNKLTDALNRVVSMNHPKQAQEANQIFSTEIIPQLYYHGFIRRNRRNYW